MTRVGAALALLLAGLVSPLATSAQGVAAGPVLQTYTFEDPSAAGLESIQLLSIPFAVAVPVLPSLTLSPAG